MRGRLYVRTNSSVQRLICIFLLLFCLQTTQDGSEHRGPGALVPGPAGLCRTFPDVESAEDPSVRPLSAGSVSVQAASEGRGPDSPPAGLGAVPAHKEQRAGPDSPGESGEQQPQCLMMFVYWLHQLTIHAPCDTNILLSALFLQWFISQQVSFFL